MNKTNLEPNVTYYKRDDEKTLKQFSLDVKKSKILFYISTVCIILTLIMILTNLITMTIGFLATLYFLAMIIILLPKINRINNDALDIKNKNFEEFENKVLAVFPIDENYPNKEWMVFIQTSENEYIELEIPCEIGNSIKEGDIVYAKCTLISKIVMEIIKK